MIINMIGEAEQHLPKTVDAHRRACKELIVKLRRRL